MGPSGDAKLDALPAQGGQGAPRAHPVEELLLFAGAVRHSPLLKATRRNVLDLPLLDGQTIGTQWQDALSEVCASVPIRVLTDAKSPVPKSMSDERTSIEPDDVAFLGTGGVLRAAARGRKGKLLIATGGSVLGGSLAVIVEQLLSLDADVGLVAEHDGTPTGLMLVSAEVLREMPGAGYMDFKEQCLPGIAQRHRVRVLRASAAERVCFPVRDREQYLGALSHLSDRKSFTVIEPGAEMATTSRARDAVVLAGARVGDKAIVARSILGPGASIAKGQVVTDAILGSGA